MNREMDVYSSNGECSATAREFSSADDVVKILQDNPGSYVKYHGDKLDVKTIHELFSGEGMKADSGKTMYSLVPIKYFNKLYNNADDQSVSDFDLYSDLLYDFKECNYDGVLDSLLGIMARACRGLSDFEFLTMIADMYTFGAQKYEANSWMSVDITRYLDALGRHMSKGFEAVDEDSGYKHLVHIGWNCMAILYLWENK